MTELRRSLCTHGRWRWNWRGFRSVWPWVGGTDCLWTDGSDTRLISSALVRRGSSVGLDVLPATPSTLNPQLGIPLILDCACIDSDFVSNALGSPFMTAAGVSAAICCFCPKLCPSCAALSTSAAFSPGLSFSSSVTFPAVIFHIPLHLGGSLSRSALYTVRKAGRLTL
jgi:hypothetical protein